MPSTATRRAAIQRLGVAARAQAGARDQLGDPLALGRRPALAAHRLIARRRRDERRDQGRVAGADAVFGMPLHAEAEAARRVLDRLDHAVRRAWR